jgi:hypothetical protein
MAIEDSWAQGGAPRDPKALFFTASSGYPIYYGDKPSNYEELSKSNQHYADIAASRRMRPLESIESGRDYAYP